METVRHIVFSARETPLADLAALEDYLLELGMGRESFSIEHSCEARLRLEFWEPDRQEAIYILSSLRKHGFHKDGEAPAMQADR